MISFYFNTNHLLRADSSCSSAALGSPHRRVSELPQRMLCIPLGMGSTRAYLVLRLRAGCYDHRALQGPQGSLFSPPGRAEAVTGEVTWGDWALKLA